MKKGAKIWISNIIYTIMCFIQNLKYFLFWVLSVQRLGHISEINSICNALAIHSSGSLTLERAKMRVHSYILHSWKYASSVFFLLLLRVLQECQIEWKEWGFLWQFRLLGSHLCPNISVFFFKQKKPSNLKSMSVFWLPRPRLAAAEVAHPLRSIAIFLRLYLFNFFLRILVQRVHSQLFLAQG